MVEKKEEKNPNTSLWDSVSNTDPEHTKDFTRTGGFRGTAIKPMYLIKKATELWGPMGDKWGAAEADRMIESGMVYIKAKVYYPVMGGEGEVEHWGGDVILRSDGKPNDEAVKMAFTDAIGKCLTQLGFSADIYLGEFTDSKYHKEEKEEKKEDEECFKSHQERVAWGSQRKDEFFKAKTIDALEKAKAKHQPMIDKLKSSKHHLDAMLLDEIKAAFTIAKGKLSTAPIKDDEIPHG